MQTISLTEETVKRLTTADDARICRALEALHSGSMTVVYQIDRDTIRASVTSVVWIGKKKPRCEEHRYVVEIGPHYLECSCPDWEHRHPDGGCKHILLVACLIQEQGNQEQQQAA